MRPLFVGRVESAFHPATAHFVDTLIGCEMIELDNFVFHYLE
jgi:hypothetical protein